MIFAFQFTVVAVTVVAIFVAMLCDEDGRAILVVCALIGFIILFVWCLAGVVQHLGGPITTPPTTTQLERSK